MGIEDADAYGYAELLPSRVVKHMRVEFTNISEFVHLYSNTIIFIFTKERPVKIFDNLFCSKHDISQHKAHGDKWFNRY